MQNLLVEILMVFDDCLHNSFIYYVLLLGSLVATCSSASLIISGPNRLLSPTFDHIIHIKLQRVPSSKLLESPAIFKKELPGLVVESTVNTALK